MKKQIFSVLSALTAGFALELRAQDVNGDGLVTYLVPISVPQAVHGALGTTWQTELWIHNGADLPVMLGGCGGFVPCLRPYHSPGVTEQASEVGSNLGSMIFDLNASGAGNVTFSSRLFELSRHTQPAGVQMPVVREERFFTRTSRFIGISGSSASRVALRVYDPRRRVGGAVRVEILDENDVAKNDRVFGGSFGGEVAALGEVE